MKILEQFTRRQTQSYVVDDGVTLRMSVVNYLVPDPRHYATVVYIEVDERSADMLSENDDSCEDLFDYLLETMGSEIVPMIFEGVVDLTALYAETYSIPDQAVTRDGRLVENMSTCFVFQKPSAPGVSLCEPEEDCEVNVTFAQMPVIPMTDEALQEILATHMAAMGQVFVFAQPTASVLFDMKVPDEWVDLVKAVMHVRDAYVWADQSVNHRENTAIENQPKEWHELTERQKFMVYRCVVEEMTLALSVADDESDPRMTTTTLTLSPRQRMFKAACVVVTSMATETIRGLVARLEEAEIEKLQAKPAEIETQVTSDTATQAEPADTISDQG